MVTPDIKRLEKDEAINMVNASWLITPGFDSWPDKNKFLKWRPIAIISRSSIHIMRNDFGKNTIRKICSGVWCPDCAAARY